MSGAVSERTLVLGDADAVTVAMRGQVDAAIVLGTVLARGLKV